MPAARVSAAVTRLPSTISSGFQVAAIPSGCGKSVAPFTYVGAVDAVDAVDDRDLEPRPGGRRLDGADDLLPLRGRHRLVVHVQDRAHAVGDDRLLQLGGVDLEGGALAGRDHADLELRHLADLLLERHLRDELAHALGMVRPRGGAGGDLALQEGAAVGSGGWLGRHRDGQRGRQQGQSDLMAHRSSFRVAEKETGRGPRRATARESSRRRPPSEHQLDADLRLARIARARRLSEVARDLRAGDARRVRGRRACRTSR